MQTANKLFVIGIGHRPLEKRAKGILVNADVILASGRLLEVFERYDDFPAVQDKVKVINNVNDTMAFIHSFLRTPDHALRTIVLIASGDPLFFGIGRKVCEELGEENVEILPDLSSIQVAFARINVPWDDAFFISLHGGPDAAKRRKLPYEIGDIPALLERHGKLAILTDKENNPSIIAKVIDSAFRTPCSRADALEDAGCKSPHSALSFYVCERLGYPDEKITRGTPEEIARLSFSDPNVVILMKKQDPGSGIQDEGKQEPRIKHSRPFFGIREDEIEHERGLITKDEIRAVTLHKLRLPGIGVLWDIGAGSGSISLEAALLCPDIRVFAVEKDAGRLETIRANMGNYGISNVSIVPGTAPDALAGLPVPDRVFIGGSGGNLGKIVKIVNEKMRSGIIVINAVILETLNEAQAALEQNGFTVEVAQVAVSRSKNVAGRRQLTALNPVFIVKGEKLK